VVYLNDYFIREFDVMFSVYDYLKPALPSDHSRQSRATDVIDARASAGSLAPQKILDLGCGVGASADYFKKVFPESSWVGVDIEESPEVAQRTREDASFVTFDGVVLPFEDNQFDLIYSNQVLEHVRHPEKLLNEVRRAMGSDGLFIGQTSQLEPYHSFSYWNFTIFGFKKLCEDAGLELIELRPSIDGITLTERSYLGRPKKFSKWFSEESPLNKKIARMAKLKRKSNQVTNFRKLMYCGQFVFVCKKLSN
jgi:ubiquinone/menaquinone biosynthesis C-methylase UbiE